MQMHFSEDSRVKMYPGVRDTLLACRVPIFDEVSVDDLLDSMSKRQITQLFIGLLAFKIAAALLILLAPFIATCNVPGGSWRATIPLAALMFGSVLGSLTWGLAADEFGRKPVMVFGVLVASCGAAFMVQAVSVWPSSWLALAFAYLVMGYGLGCHCVPYGIVVESLPSSNRARLLISAELGWGLGAVFGAALAGSVLDSHGMYDLALCSVIAAIGFFVVSLASLPESPRWLLKKGRISAARFVLQRLTGNVISRAQSLTSPTTVPHLLRRNAPPTSPISVGSGTTIPFNFMGRSSDSGELLFAAGQRRRDRWWNHVLAYWQLYTSWFFYGFSYYGLVIFIKNIAREPAGCSFDLTEVVVNSSAEIVGLIPFIVMAGDEASASTIFSGSLVLGAWAMLMGSSSVPHLSRTVLLLIARGAISCAETVLWVITNQAFPTMTRAGGASVCASACRVGGMMASLVIMKHLANTTVAAMLATSSLATAGFVLVFSLRPSASQSLLLSPQPSYGYDGGAGYANHATHMLQLDQGERDLLLMRRTGTPTPTSIDQTPRAGVEPMDFELGLDQT